MSGEWRKLERRCSWRIYQRRSGGIEIEGSGRGIGSRSRREGWVAATYSDSEPGFPWSLLSWQHDTERLKAAAPYNFREHVAKTTECIQDTWWQAMRTWGYARNPLFKVSYQGWLNHCCLPCLMSLTFIFFKKSTWMPIPGGSLFRWPSFHLGKKEMTLGCNQVDISGSCQRTPLTWKLQELFNETKSNSMLLAVYTLLPMSSFLWIIFVNKAKTM